MKIVAKIGLIKKKLQYEFKQPYNKKALLWAFVGTISFFVFYILFFTFIGYGGEKGRSGGADPIPLTFHDALCVCIMAWPIYLFFFLVIFYFGRGIAKKEFLDEIEYAKKNEEKNDENENLPYHK